MLNIKKTHEEIVEKDMNKTTKNKNRYYTTNRSWKNCSQKSIVNHRKALKIRLRIDRTKHKKKT